MKKIPTVFIRDLSKQPALVIPEWKPGCEWVRDGEGVATLKHDGTCCMIRNGQLYKRRELKQGQPAPADFEQADFDDETGKTVGWVPVVDGNPDDKYHLEARDTAYLDGTYELMGPKIQGNKGNHPRHVLVPHGIDQYAQDAVPRTFDGLRAFLEQANVEGIVWHHPDGRMAKIKRRDFGLKW